MIGTSIRREARASDPILCGVTSTGTFLFKRPKFAIFEAFNLLRSPSSRAYCSIPFPICNYSSSLAHLVDSDGRPSSNVVRHSGDIILMLFVRNIFADECQMFRL